MATPRAIVLCKDEMFFREIELRHLREGRQPRRLEAIASLCPRYRNHNVRCERIYWTTCHRCLEKKAEESETTIDDKTLFFWTEYNYLQRKELCDALSKAPYQQVVQTFPTEFAITKRYMLSGHTWVEAPEPTEEDALCPLPPADLELKTAQWGINHGLDGSVTDWIQTGLFYRDPWWRNQWSWVGRIPSPIPPPKGSSDSSSYRRNYRNYRG
ncbi:hypothetical protein GGS26DRAFT_591843 [Hypomontagnella submonticulosa]|nr:hypothetical protein GGS26DRAFT_591843 [Hypomontagnella submonticulosa]